MPSVHNNPLIPIKVKLNQRFTISLESNPSTGYTWIAEYDSSKIEQARMQEFELTSEAIGGVGVELFEFIAKKKGAVTLKMKYQREWEKTPFVVKEFKVVIE